MPALLLGATIVVVLLLVACWWLTMRMPGKRFRGELPSPTESEIALGDQLRRDVETLALRIGERNIPREPNMRRTVDWLEEQLSSAGHSPRRCPYTYQGRSWDNLEVELPGSGLSDDILVVGAHYDSVIGSPGANDNGSGCAALLELARHFTVSPGSGTLRLVFFANEEPPTFLREGMGSFAYARACRERGETVTGMISLETIGTYFDEPGSQSYPFPLSLFYPSTGNFIAFVGNLRSRPLLHRSIAAFRQTASVPSEGGALPEMLPGVGWSDHWSFWRFGYPAIMITDTALFRDSTYHTPLDLPDHLDYQRFALVVEGLKGMIEELRA
ncbi:MAG: M28 family peptidase [Thermoanaerobaculia bacterium]|nr:M28 family peptidase [Thermoanaerobaculia bacterium]